MLAAESFDGRRRIDVGHRRYTAIRFIVAHTITRNIIGNARAHQLLPAVFDLRNFRHVGHGASGIEIWKDDNLAGAGEYIGALGHEMHAAKNNVFAGGPGGLLRQLVRVSAKVGEANHFVALIMVAEDDGIAAQYFSGGTNAIVQRVVGQDEIILQTANSSCGSHVLTRFQLHTSTNKNFFTGSNWNGDVESLQRFQQTHYASSLNSAPSLRGC